MSVEDLKNGPSMLMFEMETKWRPERKLTSELQSSKSDRMTFIRSKQENVFLQWSETMHLFFDKLMQRSPPV